MSKTILLTSKKYPGYETIVDDEDYEILKLHKWYPIVNVKSNTIYVQTMLGKRPNRSFITLHRFIMQLHGHDINKQDIDHEDHNGMNNQKYNLRICSHSKNMQNAKKQKRITSSIYKGVCIHRTSFAANIRLNKKQIYIGLYETEEDAAKAYDKKALELFGEYAHLNFPLL